jgi:hypothetical protein
VASVRGVAGILGLGGSEHEGKQIGGWAKTRLRKAYVAASLMV